MKFRDFKTEVNRKGVTLIEYMVLIAILGILAAVLIPKLQPDPAGKDPAKRVEYFTKALSARTASDGSRFKAVAYNNRGDAYLHLDEDEKAKADFLLAIELDTGFPEPYCNLGAYYWKNRSDRKKALEYFETCFKKGYSQWSSLYSGKSDGKFLKGLNDTAEFKALVSKYKN